MVEPDRKRAAEFKRFATGGLVPGLAEKWSQFSDHADHQTWFAK